MKPYIKPKKMVEIKLQAKFSLFILACIIFTTTIFASTIKTPNDVYAKAQLLKEKIIFIRNYQNIKSPFPKVPKQINKTPGHVLQKSLEILSKINRYRIINDFGKIYIPQYPSLEITPNDVYFYVQRLHQEIDPFIKNQTFLKSLKEKTYTNKTPNDVYELLWNISLSMDPLFGMRGFTPTDVYNKSETIIKIAKFLRNSQGHFTKVEKPHIVKVLHPNHAINQSYKLLAQISKIEKRLWIKPVDVPKKVYKVTTPTQVYDSLQNIIAEMQRIKTRLGLQRNFKTVKTNKNKTPTNVVENLMYAQALLPDFSVDKKLIQYDRDKLHKTPSEVFALTQAISKKLTLIAQYKGITLDIKTPPYINNLSPKHVYQKGLEAIEKAIKLKTREGFFKSDIPNQPFQKVTPDEAYALIDRLDSIVSLILQQNYDKTIKEYKYSINKIIFKEKTPSDVYNNLWKISNILDILLGKEYTPNETYTLALHINNDILSLLTHFNIKSKNKNKKLLPTSNKTPSDVFNESLKLYANVNKIKQRANIKSTSIDIPQQTIITPNTVYNALRIIIASLNELQTYYEINQNEISLEEINKNKTPSDVYNILKTTNANLLELFNNEKY